MVEEINRTKLFELRGLMNRKNCYPQRLFIADKKTYFLASNGVISQSMSIPQEDFYHFKPKSKKRGDILEAILKIEFIIDQILIFKICEQNLRNAENINRMQNITDVITFFEKMKLLKKWSLINNKIFTKIDNIRQLRNVLAHQWKVENAVYKNKRLVNNYEDFESDIKECVEKLLTEYHKICSPNTLIEEMIRDIERI